MSHYNTECIVLKSINYKDADKIYTFYSKEYGKISASAKGVRKISSKRAGNLDTINHVVIGISENSVSSYKTVTEAKSVDTFKNVKKDLKLCGYAFYICELVCRFIEDHDVNEDLFILLIKVFSALNKNIKNPILVINYFEVNFMKILGYEMSLDKCVFCKRLFDENWESVGFNFDYGGLVCDLCAGKKVVISKETANMLSKLAGVKHAFRVDTAGGDKVIKRYLKEKLEYDLNSLRVFGVC